MKFMQSHGPLLRAVGVLSAVGVLVTGVTFAALQSQTATLTGNSIQSATADLRIGTSTTAALPSTFTASRVGFEFEGVVPGGPAMPAAGHTFYLKNAGSSQLALKLTAGGPLTNTQAVDLSKVHLTFTREGSTTPQKFSLQQLSQGAVVFDTPIPATTGNIVQYHVQASMDEAAFEGTGVGTAIENIALVFSGTAVN